MDGVVYGKTCLGEDVGTVVLPAHCLFAFLLMELEEERFAAGLEEPVEGVQAVAIAIDLDVAGLDAKRSRSRAASAPLAASGSWSASRLISAVLLCVEVTLALSNGDLSLEIGIADVGDGVLMR